MNETELVDIYTYVPSKGGFLKPIRLILPIELSSRLKVGYARVDKDGYWGAVRLVKMALADIMKIPRWTESYFERTEKGDIRAPISIISFEKVKR